MPFLPPNQQRQSTEKNDRNLFYYSLQMEDSLSLAVLSGELLRIRSSAYSLSISFSEPFLQSFAQH